ncbi:hypothetical protein Q31a_41520 [Aureliella helgolandensis]|uniref:Uncharacterized protein n=1 Tax=Aureliella helgolandensis TaxID=2527968 RepID=A0A518GB62_9BACT|nr:hypothetical protein Q31a_41520 [Aureliella helgolandensis]
MSRVEEQHATPLDQEEFSVTNWRAPPNLLHEL